MRDGVEAAGRREIGAPLGICCEGSRPCETALVGAHPLCALPVAGAAAQETRGNISGTVQDAQGVVPGATVRITNIDTNTTQVLVTNNTGYFEAPLLQPGTYRIVVEMAGFKTITRDGVALAVGQQINIPFTLEVGSISEQVTVTAPRRCSTRHRFRRARISTRS